MPEVRRSAHRVTASASVLLLLVVAGAAGLAAGAPPPTNAGAAGGLPGPWASYDTGRVSVVLPAALPQVELYQDANSSVRATLQVDQIVEITPGGFPHPHVVAAAFAEAVEGYNGSATTNATSWPISLSAELEVRPVNDSLWASGNAVLVPVGGPIGLSILTITYSLINSRSASAGVAVNWSVTGWPWVSDSDLLAIELHFTLPSGQQLTACSVGSDPESGPAACPGTPLGTNGIWWGSTYTGVEGSGGSGPMAAVGWNASAELPSGSASAYTVGAYSTGNGSAEILLGAPARGASAVAGGVDFSLVTPASGPVARLLGDPLAFGGALVGVTAASLLGLVLYRRRDRRLRDEL
jgi:hypothetical protein